MKTTYVFLLIDMLTMVLPPPPPPQGKSLCNITLCCISSKICVLKRLVKCSNDIDRALH